MKPHSHNLSSVVDRSRRDEGMKEIGPIYPYDLNDHDEVVGSNMFPPGSTQGALLWSPDKGLVDLGNPGGQTVVAFGINNAGKVIGTYNKGATTGFIWDATSGMRNLDVDGWPFDISERSEVLCAKSGNLSFPFVYDLETGATKPVGHLKAPARYPLNFGFGQSRAGSGKFLCNVPDPTLSGLIPPDWEEGRTVHLVDSNGSQGIGRLYCDEDFLFKFAQKLNTGNPTVKRYLMPSAQKLRTWIRIDSTLEAFIWDSGKGEKLTRLIGSESGWSVLRTAWDINHSGQIVGGGELEDGQSHAYLLTPIEESAGTPTKNP